MIQETKITKYKKPIFLARGLTKDQEKYLGKIIKNSDEKDPARKQAIGELIYHNQNLMYSATNYYMPKLSTWGLDRDDFLSEANFAILRSAEKFDYTRARFSTLVYKAVYNSFTQLINKTNGKRKVKLKTNIDDFEKIKGRSPEKINDENHENENNKKYTMEILLEKLDRLPTREKEIIKRRFLDSRTLEQVAKEFGGISKERVRQIQNSGFEQLREDL